MTLQSLIFATGIECSYPRVNGKRRDQLEETLHYACWQTDLELCRELGVKFLRYGVPYYQMHVGADRYDWSWTDEVLPEIRSRGIEPILDLCHFGVPDWVGGFTNTDWPELFVAFAEAFCKRYPWIRFYTPVNEIHVCARFSCKNGWWNDQKTDDTSFVRALITQCRASLLSMERILEHRPDAVFIQSEAAEAFFAEDPNGEEEASFQNKLRFFTFDFLYGHPVDPDVLYFLLDHGETREDYYGAMEYGRRIGPRCIMGMDYYAANERTIRAEGNQEVVGPTLGWHTIARDYYERYRKPMMLTETNTLNAEEAPRWMWNTWHNVDKLRQEGVPVLGFTWYSLQNQVDWDVQLREFNHRENGNGLYDLDRNSNSAAAAFKSLVSRYENEPILHDTPIGGLV